MRADVVLDPFTSLLQMALRSRTWTLGFLEISQGGSTDDFLKIYMVSMFFHGDILIVNGNVWRYWLSKRKNHDFTI
jgi:hypothetical protein